MRLLLDTHVLLWWLAGDRHLPTESRDAIESPENECAASVATVWEIEIKRAANRLKAPTDVIGTLERVDIPLLPIEGRHAVAAARLPAHHADPFDRVLVAQASLDGFMLVTHDARMRAYGVSILEA